jgi:hypothetical protein
MSFSDTCIETICELCAEVVRYGKDGRLGETGPEAILVIKSLANIANTLDLPLFPADAPQPRNPDGYFLGNLLNAVSDQDDQQAVDFLALMARNVPELGHALERYELQCQKKPAFVATLNQLGQSDVLQKVLLAYHRNQQDQAA